ncbi:MAG: response regulator [Kofleriaceae bacterium]
MSLPLLLLVDDSEAILSFEAACLSADYAIATANNGRDALDVLAQRIPDAVLLDLSMPELDGEEVLRRMRADPRLATIPVIVISSEEVRARACLGIGADAVLPKPIRADVLRATVNEVLAAALARRRRAGLACVPIGVGGVPLALPLAAVRQVFPYPATRVIPTGPSWLREFAEIYGEPVLVLDLAERFGLRHAVPVLDRKLVVLERAGAGLALLVDRVHDPEEIGEDDVVARDEVGGTHHGELAATLVAMVQTAHGRVPVLDPGALFDSELLARLVDEIRALEPAP